MKRNPTTRLLLCFALSFTTLVASAQQNGPDALPRSLLAQLHAIPASSVTTEVIELAGNNAIVTASAGGQRCMFDMTQAPTGVDKASEWLIGGMDCKKQGGGGIPIVDLGELENAR